MVSPNAEDGNYTASLNYANSWGADVYIVTHTNAPGGNLLCPQSPSYLLVMHKDGLTDSIGLKNELLYFLDPATPGGQNNWSCDAFDECYPSATHRAYVELFFHTNTSATSWFEGNGSEGSGGVQESWRYGASVDVHLDYP